MPKLSIKYIIHFTIIYTNHVVHALFSHLSIDFTLTPSVTKSEFGTLPKKFGYKTPLTVWAFKHLNKFTNVCMLKFHALLSTIHYYYVDPDFIWVVKLLLCNTFTPQIKGNPWYIPGLQLNVTSDVSRGYNLTSDVKLNVNHLHSDVAWESGAHHFDLRLKSFMMIDHNHRSLYRHPNSQSIVGFNLNV